jgi:hypothetical protein
MSDPNFSGITRGKKLNQYNGSKYEDIENSSKIKL